MGKGEEVLFSGVEKKLLNLTSNSLYRIFFRMRKKVECWIAKPEGCPEYLESLQREYCYVYYIVRVPGRGNSKYKTL